MFILIQVSMSKIITNTLNESVSDGKDQKKQEPRRNRSSDLEEKTFHQAALFSDWIKTGTSPNPSPSSVPSIGHSLSPSIGHSSVPLIGHSSSPSIGHPDLPMFISDMNNNFRGASLIDRAIVRAPWNNLAAKMFKDLATFFLDSYLVQLFGVTLPI